MIAKLRSLAFFYNFNKPNRKDVLKSVCLGFNNQELASFIRLKNLITNYCISNDVFNNFNTDLFDILKSSNDLPSWLPEFFIDYEDQAKRIDRIKKLKLI